MLMEFKDTVQGIHHGRQLNFITVMNHFKFKLPNS